MKPLDNIATYLVHEEIFGFKSDLDNVKSLIAKNKQIGRLLPILSQLGSIESKKGAYEIFKKDFRKYLYHLLDGIGTEHDVPAKYMSEAKGRIDKQLAQRELLSTQVILFTWKYILAFGNGDFDISIESVESDYLRSLSVPISLSDHLVVDHKDILAEVFQSYMFYSSEEFSSTLARTLLIYTKIARDKQQYNKEHVDFETKFIEKYGCSLEDYIFTLLSIYALFSRKIPDSNRITDDWYQSIDKAFQLTTLRQNAKKILQPLMFTFDEAKRELQTTYHDPWDYRFFSRKPLFNLKDDIIFPVSFSFLENSMYEGLYWKIRDCFPQEDNSFQSFFGRPFEHYVTSLIKQSCAKSKIPYEIIEEFAYGRPEKRSPDVMIRYGKKLIAIESKSHRLNYKRSIVEGNLDSIEEDRIKMTVKPMEQLYKRMKELFSGASGKVDLSGIEEVYLIVVNQGVFPTLPPLERKTIQQWSELKGLKAKVRFYYMSIEELEMLSSVLERKKPIFPILNHKQHFPYTSFRMFLHKQLPNISLPQILIDAKNEIVLKISQGRFLK